MKKQLVLFAASACLAASALHAQSASGRDAFIRQQAMAELQRVTSQLDVLQNNYDALERRIARLERGGETDRLQAEVRALSSQVEELKRQLRSQREEIINELSGKMSKIMAQNNPPPKPQPQTKTVVEGPHYEYTVQRGDSMYVIAKAFHTTIAKIQAMNPGLNVNAIKPGQKINVPKE